MSPTLPTSLLMFSAVLARIELLDYKHIQAEVKSFMVLK